MTAPARFRLGFMLRVPQQDENGSTDPARLFRDALDLAVAIEDCGFDSLWVTQHHFGAVDSALPSPLVFLAAVAARTRRIHLGTTVITAALEHPLRLAEDAATLDAISGGRVELGLGTSSDATERAIFGVDAATQRDTLHRHALVARDAFLGHHVDGSPDVFVEPTAPGLAQRMWMATITRANALVAAEHGFGLITNYRPSTLDEQNRDYPHAYVEACRQHGTRPRVGLSRGIFPTHDVAAARQLLLPHAVRFTERGRRLGWVPESFTPDDFFDREDFHFGHPDEVIARLARDPGLPFTTELLCGMLSTRLAPRQLVPIVEAIASEVAPALGWSPGYDEVPA